MASVLCTSEKESKFHVHASKEQDKRVEFGLELRILLVLLVLGKYLKNNDESEFADRVNELCNVLKSTDDVSTIENAEMKLGTCPFLSKVLMQWML